MVSVRLSVPSVDRALAQQQMWAVPCVDSRETRLNRLVIILISKMLGHFPQEPYVTVASSDSCQLVQIFYIFQWSPM